MSKYGVSEFYNQVVGVKRQKLETQQTRESSYPNFTSSKQENDIQDSHRLQNKQINLQYQTAISKDNVGYRLLSKQGWKPGEGLGTNNRGVSEPIQSQAVPGRQGIGFTKKVSNVQKPQVQNQEPQKQYTQQQNVLTQSSSISQNKQKVQEIIDLELESETVQDKVNYHNWHTKLAEDEQIQKQKAKNLYNDFKFSVGEDTSGKRLKSVISDRKSKVYASNPLL